MSELVDRGAGAVTGTDAVELILADHREMERLLAELRDDTSDRAAVLGELADLLVGHAEAEEDTVYDVLEREADDEETEDEVAHGEEEHAEINEALLAVLVLDDLYDDTFNAQLEELDEVVHHHLSEEERNVLNPARELVDEAERSSLGERFLRARAEALESRPGAVERVRKLVEQARDEGLLD